MQFVNPWMLAGLAALAVPVLVHLFNFRRYKTVYFSNVTFLKQVQQETTSRNKLKHLLVLATRMLAVFFIVFAFARPFFQQPEMALKAGRKYVSVYIDNSFSMNAVSGGRTLFDKAKQAAREIAGNFSADDRFQLLANNFDGKQQHLVSKEELLSMIDALEISPAVRTLDEVATRQGDALSRENGANKVVYMLSDFQQYMGGFTPDSTVKYHLVPLAADEAPNVYIDSVWFTEPVQLINQPTQLVVKVSNSGNKASENNRLVLKLNEQTKNMLDFSIDAGSYVIDTLGFTPTQAGWNKAELMVQDFPITYDDNFFVAFNVVEKLQVSVIDNGLSNPFIAALFNNQPEFNFTKLTPGSTNSEALGSQQLVIVEGVNEISSSLGNTLLDYVAQGGAIALFPPVKCDEASYNRFFNSIRANPIAGFSETATELAPLETQKKVFKDVFRKVPDNLNLPAVRQHYTYTTSAVNSEESILSFKTGGSLLSRYPYQNGSVYVSAVPLTRAASDLPVHAIFAPMMYRMALLNAPVFPISYFIGDKARIPVQAAKGSGEQVYTIQGNGTEFIPEQFTAGNNTLLGLRDQVNKSGFYNVLLNKQAQNNVLALNFDRKESKLAFNTAADLSKLFNTPNVRIVNGANAEVASVVKSLENGSETWRWCIVLALIFLAAEIALLRFWKN